MDFYQHHHTPDAWLVKQQVNVRHDTSIRLMGKKITTVVKVSSHKENVCLRNVRECVRVLI